MRRTNEPVVEEFRGESISVDGVDHWVCDGCGETLMSPEAARQQAERLQGEYRLRHRMLSAGDITALRKGLGLTQREFEKMLGVSTPTVSRWEHGAVPTLTADRLMRCIRSIPDAESLLRELVGLPERRGSVLEMSRASARDGGAALEG